MEHRGKSEEAWVARVAAAVGVTAIIAFAFGYGPREFTSANILSLSHQHPLLMYVLAVMACIAAAAYYYFRIAHIARADYFNQAALYDNALNNMSQGLAMFSADQSLIYCSDRYLELYRLTREDVRPGMPLRDLLELRRSVGTFVGDSDVYLTKMKFNSAGGKVAQSVLDLPDGRAIRSTRRDMTGGGWVTTHEDITEHRALELKLADTSRFLESLIENIPVGVSVKSVSDLRYTLVNRAFEQLIRKDRKNLIGHVPTEVLPYAAVERFVQDDRRAIAGDVDEEGRIGEYDMPQGSLTLHTRRIVLRGQGGEPEYLVNIIEDVTGQRALVKQVEETKRFLETVVDNIPVALMVKRVKDDRYVLVNRDAIDLFGRDRAALVDKSVDEIYKDGMADVIRRRDASAIAQKGEVYSGIYPVEHPVRGMRMFAGRRVAVMNDAGEADYVILTQEDITERRQNETRIAHMAFHDTLTKMPNRAAFTQSLTQMIEACQGEDSEFAVLSIDLDRFKEINDVFGHAFGDKILKEVAHAIQVAAGGAAVARLSGDEFALIIDGPQPEAGRALAERIIAAMGNEFQIDGKTLRVGLTCGMSIYPRDGEDPATLLTNADVALYRAKVEARGTVRAFASEMDQVTRDRRAMHLELSQAIRNNELSLFYQPQMSTADSKITGFEALVRWHHPVRGVVSPGIFIPIAEESTLIVDMGEWVLRQACREAASWPEPLRIAVNLSPVQFLHGDIVALVHTVLLETGLAPSRLELEITEGVLIRDFDRGVALLRRLKGLGVRIAMDDFGTGYSSLSYLQSFPFDKIKIDRAFVKNLGRNAQSAAIVRAVISLGRGLSIPTVAEGVETREQLDFLTEVGCDQVQGYFIGMPEPIKHYANITGKSKPGTPEAPLAETARADGAQPAARAEAATVATTDVKPRSKRRKAS